MICGDIDFVIDNIWFIVTSVKVLDEFLNANILAYWLQLYN